MSQALEAIHFAGTLTKNEPMRLHTTMRVGGPADYFLSPKGEGDVLKALRVCQEEGLPLTILGRGSNLLVRDGGLSGLVLFMGEDIAEVQIEGLRIFAQAGAALVALSRRAQQAGLSGLEFAEGIPGSLGGAVLMNAGAYGGEMRQVVESVRVMDKDGRILTLSGQECEFAYRHSRMMEEGLVVLSATLLLKEDDKAAIAARMADYSARRREKQPLQYPSCGSFFKRPEGYFAGKLIEEAGLKGIRVNDAQISCLHAGFLINRGNASTRDILELMRLVQDRVFEEFGVRLEPEVRIVGRE